MNKTKEYQAILAAWHDAQERDDTDIIIAIIVALFCLSDEQGAPHSTDMLRAYTTAQFEGAITFIRGKQAIAQADGKQALVDMCNDSVEYIRKNCLQEVTA
jgi:hypothetical protein